MVDYDRQRLRLSDGAQATMHILQFPAAQLKFEDLHPMNSFVRKQDVARMAYARARAQANTQPQILTWAAMHTDRPASQLFADIDRSTEHDEQIVCTNSFITYTLRQLLARGWLQLHEYIGDTYEWKVEIPPAYAGQRPRAEAVLAWLEDALQLYLYPNIGRGSYQPRNFSAFDLRQNFIRVGRCDFLRHFAQSNERQLLFNTSHALYAPDDLRSHHSGYGDPVGLLAAAGTILRPPVYRRGTMLYDGARWRIEVLGMDDLVLHLPGELHLSADADAERRFELNPPLPTPYALYTCAGDGKRPLGRSPHAPGHRDFVVVNRQIVSWKRDGDLEIPLNGFVLSLREHALPRGSCERLVEDAWLEYAFDARLGKVERAMQAGPIVLQAGVPTVAVDALGEEFFASRECIPPLLSAPSDERRARAALGLLPDGNLLLLMVDGCEAGMQTGWDSAGIRHAEFAEQLRRAGVVSALGLGHGGACQLFLRGGLANVPSDRRGQQGLVYERMVPSIGVVG